MRPWTPSGRHDDGLKDAHREAIIATIAANERVERAVLFGSRATGANTVSSDVDIALFGDRLTLTDQARLAAALDEIPMAQSVDLLLYDSIRDRRLREHIRNHGVDWYVQPSPICTDLEKWPIRRFEELLHEPVRNGTYKSKEHQGHGVKIVNMGEVFAHPRLRAVPMKRVDLSDAEVERFSVLEGDLLFAPRSLVAEGAGRCCVVLDVDEPTTFESSIIRARPDATRSASLYWYYFFCSPSGLHCIDTIRRQVAVAGITGRDLSRLEVPAPPLAEQHTIAHILGTLDDKIELNRRMNATLEAMARALFQSWFVDFDPVRAKMAGCDTGLPKDIADLFPDRLVDSEMGEVPERWTISELGDMIELAYGKALKAKARNAAGVVPVFGSNGQIGWHDEALVERPGIVVGRKGNPGTVTLSPTEFFPIDTTFYVVSKHERGEFLYFLFFALQEQDLPSVAADSAVPGLNRNLAYMNKQLRPPTKVVECFDRYVHAMYARRRHAATESRLLVSLRDTLLPKLVSGDVRTVSSSVSS